MARISLGLASASTTTDTITDDFIAAGTFEQIGSVAAGGLADDDTFHVDTFTPGGEQESSFATLDLVQTYELASGDSTELFSTFGVKSLIAVTDNNCKWEVPSEDGSFYDFHIMAAVAQNASTSAGAVTEGAMPPYIRLTDTSAGPNTVTIYATFL